MSALPKRDPQSRYYDEGGIETLDIIKAKLTTEQYEGYLLGNMIKYSCRMNFKGNFDRDNRKVGFYSKFLDELLADKFELEMEEPQDSFEEMLQKKICKLLLFGTKTT